MPTKKAVATKPSEELLQELASQFPQEEGFTRPAFPKFVFTSQTKLDDDDNVSIKAGTMFIDSPSDEKDENGRVMYEREELGKEVEGHIIYMRKRLQMWDDDAEKFYSTPIYDQDTDIIPLFGGSDFVADGTPAQLRSLYMTSMEVNDFKTGEPKTIQVSKLKPQRVLYILVNGKLAELTIGGTSMRQFSDYHKKNQVPLVITKLYSSAQKKGSNKWNQMEFEVVRDLTAEEAELGAQHVRDLKEMFAAEKAYYDSKRVAAATATTPAIAQGESAALPEALPEATEEEEGF